MKKRIAFWVEFQSKLHPNQFFLPSEFHLIKTCLKDGRIVTRLERRELDESTFKHHFG